MQPTAILLKNMRCFMGQHRLPLRPLTLIYGRNNVGKSALLRAIPLLADTLAGGDEPLALGSQAARGAGFDQLRCQLESDLDDDLEPTIGLGLEWSRDALRRVELDWIGDGRADQIRVPVLSRLALTDDSERALSFRRRRTPDRSIAYDIERADGAAESRAVEFDGPFPIAPDLQRLSAAQAQLRAWARSVEWLSADRRPRLDGLVRPTGGSVARLDPQGRNTLDILARREDVRRRVGDFYEELVGRRLEARDLAGKGYEFVLRLNRDRPLDVPVTDIGEGLVQALPVVTALALAELGTGAGLIAIEEPESHQHGDLQEKLAQLIGRLAAQSPDRHLVIETHSEVILLTTQLMIAEGALPPEHVLMYWVRRTTEGVARAEPVEFDRLAQPSGNLPWRPFSEDNDLKRRILIARKNISATSARVICTSRVRP